jgi:dihydroorotate dehydrogenase electron transfer subunit
VTDAAVETGPTAVDGNPPEQGGTLVKLPEPSRPRPVPVAESARVLAHRPVADRYRFLSLHAPGIADTALPGQFVMVTVARPGQGTPVLPRPMAIYRRDSTSGIVDILYGVVGNGTRQLATFAAGEELLLVGPLGRPFEVAGDTHRVLLVGRGIGTCSLTTVAEDNRYDGNLGRGNAVRLTAVTSGRTRAALIGADLYREAGAEHVYEVCDEDGTSDPETLYARLAADLDADPPDLVLTCGSERLLRLCGRLATRWGSRVQVSVEAHMACGIGYCHGCASGARGEGEESPLVCVDGPVFGWRPEPVGLP